MEIRDAIHNSPAITLGNLTYQTRLSRLNTFWVVPLVFDTYTSTLLVEYNLSVFCAYLQ